MIDRCGSGALSISVHAVSRRMCRAEGHIQSSTLPEDHAHLVSSTIIHQRNSGRAVRQRLAVQRGVSDSTADAMGVLDRNLVARSDI